MGWERKRWSVKPTTPASQPFIFKRGRFPTENLGNPRKIADLGSRGSWVFFMVNLFERIF